ncbi:unnamed protein product [Prorocentrum cordatum]|uniref:PDEase domain-containing protein n=1 Tax=Prorocentrum cordatum TaxID=2364126 RepID=A0ABN9U8U8_9DINO|nr:unnamed protein product [Polarella glacialis]
MFVEGANEVAGGMSTEAIASLDVAVAGHVLAAVRTQAEEMLRAMRGAVASPDAQEAGGRFVGAAVTSLEVKDVLISLGIRDVLVAAVKQHPRHPGVQDSVQYALLKVVGWRAPAEVLGDPELAASPQAVSAALWALGSRGAGSEQHWDVDSLAALPWAERRELAELARAALERFPDNLVLRSRSLDVMGLMLGAKVPGSDHEVAAMAVPPIVLAMQAHLDERDLQWSAARALVRVVEGNSSAIRSLRAYRNEFIALLDSIMALQEHSQTLSNLSRVRLTVAGVVGVLEAIQGGRWGNAQVEASLQAIEKAEECDSSSLLKIDAVGLIITRGMGQDCPAPAGITALGRVLEFLIQDATAAACSTGGDLSQHQDAIQRGVDAIVCRLQAEVQSVEAGGKPYVKVYSRALIALRNVSRRSDSLGARIAASPTVKAAMKIALERDYLATFGPSRHWNEAHLWTSDMRTREEGAEAGLFASRARGQHSKHVSDLIEFVEEEICEADDEDSAPARESMGKQKALDKKLFILASVLHAADISNPCKPHKLMLNWTEKVLAEFWDQGDEELRLGLEVSPLCDRQAGMKAVPKGQIGFINFVVQPFFAPMVRIIPEVQEALDALEQNKAFWQTKDEEGAAFFDIYPRCSPAASDAAPALEPGAAVGAAFAPRNRVASLEPPPDESDDSG